MKKNYFTLFMAMILIASVGYGQNIMLNGDLESWDDSNNPSSWDKAENISQESTETHGGDYAAAHESADGTKDFQQNVEGVIGGQQYTISYYYKDNDAMARSRIWSYWLEGESTLADNEAELRPNVYSEDNAEWQHFSITLTAPAAADGFRFEVRVYKEDGQVGGHVYYDDFMVEGATTNDPEPTNYPTDFTATASGLSINLNWTDSDGEQLPGAYLIIGKQAVVKNNTLEAPVDGVPVPDDLDWSDGQVAVNVTYGQEMYVFNELEAGGYFMFDIYPYTNVGENIDYKTDGTVPSTAAIIENIVVISYEDFSGGSLGTWTQYSVTGAQVWEHSEYSGDHYAKVSGYDGGPTVNEDWLISPQMNLLEYDNVIFNFTSAMNYDGEALQLFFSQDYDGTSDPNGFTWLELTEEATWSEGGWEWTESGDVDLSLFVDESCYLAFKYTSTSEASSTWEVDNLFVYTVVDVGLFENSIEEITMYPNPTTELVSFNLDRDGEITIINLAGQTVFNQHVNAGITTVNITNLPKGLYIVRSIGNNQSVKTGKLLVK